MCTVTFIPVKDKLFLTSNRDEKNTRRSAHPPNLYLRDARQLMFPMDTEAAGSWITANDNGTVAILLNGGFVKHDPKPVYAKSRGLVLLEIIGHSLPLQYFQATALEAIEPFTIILFADGLYQLTWTGEKKHLNKLDASLSHIWSSTTLYNREIRMKREKWFRDFLEVNPFPDREDILRFHLFSGDGNKNTKLNVNIDGLLSTVSITVIELNNGKAVMEYLDLRNGFNEEIQMPVATWEAAGKL